MSPQHENLTREAMLDKYNRSNMDAILLTCEMSSTEKVLPLNGLTRRQEDYKDPETGRIKCSVLKRLKDRKQIIEKRGKYYLPAQPLKVEEGNDAPSSVQ